MIAQVFVLCVTQALCWAGGAAAVHYCPPTARRQQ